MNQALIDKQKAKQAKERAEYAIKVADIESRRKAAGLPPLKFGEKAKSIKTFNHRLESMAMAKERKKEARKLDMRLWESNKAKAVAK